jgi:peptidoglycan/xylan/chitin deacetylase (PgdA/CDA1 family)
LTFDDGQDPSGAGILEVLHRFAIHATSFLVTSCLDNQRLMWRNKLSVIVTTVAEKRYVDEYNSMAHVSGDSVIRSGSDLMRRSMQWDMSRKDEIASDLWDRCGLLPEAEYLDRYKPYFTTLGLREWLAEGHSIGFHTHTHPACSRLAPSSIDAEIIRPAIELKSIFGITQLPMSYPFGDRLPGRVEEDLLNRGIFSSLFGSEGFRGRKTSHDRLARLNLENGDVEQLVLGASLLR